MFFDSLYPLFYLIFLIQFVLSHLLILILIIYYLIIIVHNLIVIFNFLFYKFYIKNQQNDQYIIDYNKQDLDDDIILSQKTKFK